MKLKDQVYKSQHAKKHEINNYFLTYFFHCSHRFS
jgi:hypothetical protein